MKTRLLDLGKTEKRRTSLLIALGVHAVGAVVFATMSFHYNIASFLGLGERAHVDHVTFITTPPKPIIQAPGPVDPNTTTPGRAMRLIVPPNIPSTLPALPRPSAAAPTTDNIGSGSNSRNPLTVGIVPSQPDSRIVLNPNSWDFPKTPAQKTDSAIKAMLVAWHDSAVAAMLAKGRDPRDWTVDRDGQKWGWDPEGIHLGKFMIPNALLAALPMNLGKGVDPQRLADQRQADYIRQDILLHSSAMPEEDFKTAVRRIRERVDKEKKEKEAEKAKAIAAGGKTGDNPNP